MTLLPSVVSLLLLLPLPQVRSQGWLGVYLADTPHAEVAEVIPGMPAAKAGLRAGDRILAVDGASIRSPEALIENLGRRAAGDRVTFEIRRGDKRMEIRVRLGKRPPEDQIPPQQPPPVSEKPPVPPPAPPPAPAPETQKAGKPFLGVGLRQADAGLFVTRVIADSPAAEAKLRVGDRLVRWGGERVKTLGQIDRLLAKSKPGDKLALELTGASGSSSVILELATAPGSAPKPPKPPKAQAESPAKELVPPAVATPRRDPLPFGRDLAAALRASEDGKPVFLVFGASWAASSQSQQKALKDPALRTALARYHRVWLDTDENSELAAKYEVQEIPHLRILAGGETVYRHAGYLPVDELGIVLRQHRGRAQGGEVEIVNDPIRVREAGDLGAVLRRAESKLRELEAELQRLSRHRPESDELEALRAELRALRKLLEGLGTGK